MLLLIKFFFKKNFENSGRLHFFIANYKITQKTTCTRIGQNVFSPSPLNCPGSANVLCPPASRLRWETMAAKGSRRRRTARRPRRDRSPQSLEDYLNEMISFICRFLGEIEVLSPNLLWRSLEKELWFRCTEKMLIGTKAAAKNDFEYNSQFYTKSSKKTNKSNYLTCSSLSICRHFPTAAPWLLTAEVIPESKGTPSPYKPRKTHCSISRTIQSFLFIKK